MDVGRLARRPQDDAWKQAHLAMLACVPRPGNPARGIGTFRPWRQQASGALIAWAAWDSV